MKMFILAIGLFVTVVFNANAFAEPEGFEMSKSEVGDNLGRHSDALRFEFGAEMAEMLNDLVPSGGKSIDCVNKDRDGDAVPLWCMFFVNKQGLSFQPWSFLGATSQKDVFYGKIGASTFEKSPKPSVRFTFSGELAKELFKFLTIKPLVTNAVELKSSKELSCIKRVESGKVTCVFSL